MSKVEVALDPAWISPEVRNDSTVKAIFATSAGVANLVADLSRHLTEEQLSPIRDQAAGVVTFLGEILTLVTPEKPVAVIPEEVKVPAPPAPKAVKTEEGTTPKLIERNAAVEAVLAGMGAAGKNAASLLGVKEKPAPVAQAPTPSTDDLKAMAKALEPAMGPAPAPDPAQSVSFRSQNREMARVKANASKIPMTLATLPPGPVVDPLEVSELFQATSQVTGMTVNDIYEAGVIYLERWSKS